MTACLFTGCKDHAEVRIMWPVHLNGLDAAPTSTGGNMCGFHGAHVWDTISKTEAGQSAILSDPEEGDEHGN